MKRYLVLENGNLYEGEAIGAAGSVISEIVFTTSMTAYIETLTDASYKCQTVCQTFPLIGNYGIITPEMEGARVSVSGYIIREEKGRRVAYVFSGMFSVPWYYIEKLDLNELLRTGVNVDSAIRRVKAKIRGKGGGA